MSNRLPEITQLQQQFREGTNSVAAVLESCLAAIERWEDAIQAWVEIDTVGARRIARDMDEKFRRGERMAPLAGIPIGVKDIIDLAGQRTGAGSRLREQHRAHADAAVVSRLRQAGAIVLGKTVTTEWACFDPPPTRNPWNREHTPGGSSSGSAAAVATGMCVAALGSQTGGSIVRPASYCGVCGFKPTLGRVSTLGVTPISEHLDHLGPIARTASDLLSMYEAISDDDRSETKPDRLITFAGFFEQHASSEVRAAFSRSLQSLSHSGYSTHEVTLPDTFAEMHQMHRHLMAYDMAMNHGESWRSAPEMYGPRVGSLIDEGRRISRTSYDAALQHQARFRVDMNQCIPTGTIALTPSTPTSAPNRSTTGDPQFNSVWSYSGLPSATIPCGVDSHGLPCGLQIVGAFGADRQVLNFAKVAESIFGFRTFTGSDGSEQSP